MGIAAKKFGIPLSPDLAIDAEVDLVLNGNAYGLRARLKVNLPGVDRHSAQAIVDEAHETCPYSKAIRGNVEVAISIV